MRTVELPLTDITDCHLHFEDVGRIEETLDYLRGLGMTRVGVVSAPCLDCCNSNPQALALKAVAPRSVFFLAGLDYTGIDSASPSASRELEAQAARMHAAGCDGWKLLETKPNFAKQMPFPIDDPVYDRFYAFLAEQHLPVVWHVADPEQMWSEHVRDAGDVYARKVGWDYADGTYPSKEQLYRRAENVLDRFPDLVVIFAHFYFLSADLERAACLLARHPNVHLDITPGSEMYKNFSARVEEAREFFLRFQDRIVYGDDLYVSMDEPIDKRGGREKVEFVQRFLATDESFPMPEGDAPFLHRDGVMHGLALPAEVLDKIYRRNFHRLAGEFPRPLAPEAALRECERVAAILERGVSCAGERNFARHAAQVIREKC